MLPRPGHADSLPTPHTVLQQPPSELRHDKATGFGTSASGQVFAQCTGRLWRWTGEAMQPTGLPIWGHDEWAGVPVAPADMAWINLEQESIVVWGGITTHHLPAQAHGYTELRAGSPGWVVFLPGIDRQPVLALFWHPESGEQRTLRRGALGSHGISKWLTLGNGQVVACDGDGLFLLDTPQNVLETTV